MTVIDDLIKDVPPAERQELERLRHIVHVTVPNAEEVMTYGMPGFKYRNKYLVAFAAFKDHLSLFPGAQAIELHKSQLKSYQISKGTIQFSLDNPLPDSLVTDILRARVLAIDNPKK